MTRLQGFFDRILIFLTAIKNIVRQNQVFLFQERDFPVSVPEPVQNDWPTRPENQK